MLKMRSGHRLVVAALSMAVLASTVLAPLLSAQPALPVPPAPPRVFLDTSYTPPTGRTITVRAADDLQAALNTAQAGDVITLEAGATFRGNFTLPKKAGSGWIVVKSGAPDAKLPPTGTRVTPAFAPMMPKLMSPNSGPAVSTEPGAHHFRFIGIEFGAATGVKTIYAIVAFGGTQGSDADTPHDLVLDRCYIHGETGLASSRGVLLNSASSAIIDSHISEIHAAGSDSQAVLGYNGPGPFKIVNNFLEGAGENVLFGGADPKIRGLVPSDIEIRGNHLFKPLTWRQGQPGFVGVQWTIKNILELKNAQRVHVEGNVLENVWPQAQGGTAVLLTPRNQDGTAPWSVVQDVLFRNNAVKNAASGVAIQTTDDIRPSQPTKRIAIVNNLWLISRTFLGMTSGPVGPLEDLVIDHNTAIPGGHSVYYMEAGTAPAMTRLQMTNNLFGFGAYGVTFPKPDAGLAKWLPGAVIAKNALVSLGDTADGQGVNRNAPHLIHQPMYTSFGNAAAAGLNPDGTLAPGSRNRQGGTDGKDIGVDFAELQRAISGQPPR
jgi:hypothetical protein